MRRLEKTDKLLLATLLPLLAVCFTLHVREIVRTGIAAAPVFVVPGPDGYPLVGGLRLERKITWNGLEPGDRLIELGDADLRGVGYLQFDGVASEQARGSDLTTALVFERDGERRTTELQLHPYRVPWFRVPLILSWVGVATLILLSSPGTLQTRLLFASFASFSVLMASFIGGSRVQSVAHQLVFLTMGPVSVALLVRWIISFPAEVADRDRPSVWWCAVALLHPLVRVSYVFGGPLPPESVPPLAIAVDVLICAVVTGLLTANYLRATPIGRRRVKWLLYALYLCLAVFVASAALPALGLPIPATDYPSLLTFTFLAGVLVPAGLYISTRRYDLFDIDRAIAITGGHTLALLAAVALAVVMRPALTPAFVWAGASESAAQLAAPLLFLVFVPPLGNRLTRAFRAVFYPERTRIERDLGLLVSDVAECRDTRDLLELLGRRLTAILRPDGAWLYTSDGERWVPRVFEGDPLGRPFRADSTLALVLERNPEPLRIGTQAARERIDLPSAEEEALRMLGADLVLPIRQGKDLAAFCVLGPKRSGDIYTAGERELLGRAAAVGSAELRRLADVETLEYERGRTQRLEGEKREAEEENLEKTRFLAAASHDLRQPLHALGLYVKMLDERVGEPEARALLAKLETSADALSEMMTELLDLSRLDAGEVRPEISEFDLAPMVQRLVADFEPQAVARGLELHVEIMNERVRSDPMLLARVVGNLLGNAVRYTATGSVRLSVRRSGDRVAIEVADTGPGIAVEEQRRIFDAFVRLGDRKADDGLGLGLSIVERLCRLLDHELELRSEPARGSVFRVELPRAEAAAGWLEPVRKEPGGNLTGRFVLAIDDDLAVLEAMQGVLQDWGCDVLPATCVDDALEGIDARGLVPELVVADYRLGGGETGVNAIAAVRAHVGSDVPAVIVTGESAPDTREHIRASGHLFLTKPIAPHRLRAALVELLRDR